MTAIASPEFIALCRTQLQLLTQQLSQSSAALYIADVATRSGEQANFVPVVSYPEPVESWVTNFERASAAHFDSSADSSAHSHAAADAAHLSRQGASQQGHTQPLALPGSVVAESALVTAAAAQDVAFSWPQVLRPEQRLVTPLVYTDVVVGLLVAVRTDRAWNNDERDHIETLGASLAGGCVLERRNQWLQGQLAHKRGLQSRQSEVFHNLLHQFRNPLTAVSTFGQLMVKKLGSDDPNAPIATGIVRENKRLRELVSHFDEAVAIGDADMAADGAMDREGTENIVQRPQLGPQQSLLPASEVSDSLISETLIFDASTFEVSAQSDDDCSEELHGEELHGEDLHGLGQTLVLSSQHLPDIVEPVLAVASIVAGEKGISLQAQVAEDTPPVWGEEEALGEVVTNLVDNAIKYSPAGATVWVQTGVSRELDGYPSDGYERNGYQGIVVGDTGPGIPAEDLPRLFERNYRGVQAQSDTPGTGLGLAIAQSLIQDMNGFIEVISPAVNTPWLPVAPTHPTGLGTVFVVWLREVERV